MRWLVLTLLAALMVATTAPTYAGTLVVPEPDEIPYGAPVITPRDLAEQKQQLKTRLSNLFEALRLSPDQELSKEIAAQIQKVWAFQSGDTARILMGRAALAQKEKDDDLTLTLLDRILEIEPGYYFARNERAKIFFKRKQFADAMIDLFEVLRVEPRHFEALSGVGLILLEVGSEAGALYAFERAIALYPLIEKIPEQVEKLRLKVHGEPI